MTVSVGDLDDAWSKGFTELELLKRATLAGIGTCQGGACLPHVRAWIADKTGDVPDPFTARPASRQITLAEAAADTTIDVFRRTPLHDEHLALGARMDRFGSWWRPWHYGDAVGEYWAVREGVSHRRREHPRQARGQRAGRRRGARADLSVPRRGHQARPLAVRAAAQRAWPRHGRRHDRARVGDAVRAVVHVGRRRQRRDVGARLDRRRGGSAST